MTPHDGRNLVGGEWAPAASGETFERRNPTDTTDLVGRFPDSGAADVSAAVDAAVEGARGWARTPPEERARVLQRAADVLAGQAEELAAELVREEGKTLAEASMETRRTPDNLRSYAAEALRLRGESLPAGADGGFVHTAVEPVGVVGVITPWNFPLNIPSRKIGPALAAGNAVVFKPSPVTPLLAQRLVEALLAAGLPGGAIALVHGGGEVGAALAGDSRVGAVTFTGSTATGTAIHSAIGPSRRCQLEMGGKNPVIVLEDADLDHAANVIVKGAFGLSGQACTGTSRVIAHEAVHDALADRVCDLAARLRVGPGHDPGSDMGPLAAEFQLDKTLAYVESATREGGKLRTGGHRVAEGEMGRGHFVRPAVVTGLEPDMEITRQEVFGPVLGFQRCSSMEEAVELANATDYGLAAGIVTGDLNRALRFARDVESGLIKINQPTTGMSMAAPFGGLKASSTQGFKEQAGHSMMLFYTREKTVYVGPAAEGI